MSELGERYGHDRIKRGLINFVLGKGVSAIAGMFAIVLVIRSLSVQAFAGYSVLVALVEVLTAVSGLGLAHALLRYVPELYGMHFQQSLRRFVYGSLLLRSAVLLAAAAFAYAFAGSLAPHIGLGTALDAFQAFLVVVVLRSTNNFLSQILESTLHQGNAQMGFSATQTVRLIGMAVLAAHGNVALVDVIWVESIGEAAGLVVMLFGIAQVVRSGPTDDAADDGSWLDRHLRQIARFALAGYVQHLAIMPFGGNTNRLVGGNMLASAAMASYGFAQSLVDYMKRYLPAQLLVGLIRPVVVARYCERRDFSVAAGLCERVMQINLLLIGGMLVTLLVGGAEALSLISAGKYGTDALLILCFLVMVLVLETQRQQLELLVQTVERYHFLISSNLLLSSSVILAAVLVPWFGPSAFPIANGFGLIAGNAWVQKQMRNEGFVFTHDWFASFRIAGLFILAYGVGQGLRLIGLPWYLAAGGCALVYLAAGYLLCGKMVFGFINNLTDRNRIEPPELKEDGPSTREAAAGNDIPRIAFGVLSSKDSSSAIEQIAAAVYPHPVYVHHDFSKQPDFHPEAPNLHILLKPVQTAWGDWSLVAASFLLMQAALEDPHVTHFQLLSEACLPVRPLAEFEDYLRRERPDAMIDMLPLEGEDAVFSHGWRYLWQSSRSMRLLRRAAIWVWGREARHQVEASINLRLAGKAGGVLPHLRRAVGKFILRSYYRSAHEVLAAQGLRKFAIGGQWFGVSRRAAQWLIDARACYAAFTEQYRRQHIPDESYIHTLLHNALLAGLPLRMAPSNHALFWDRCGTGPDQLGDTDFERLRNSGSFFARKFSLDRGDGLRQAVLTRLQHSDDARRTLHSHRAAPQEGAANESFRAMVSQGAA
ncbi:MAG: hypothetical protein JO002_02445 [Burkholderiaceae bacterium]|nr:hypothetical protein [Burkholderiaceae bacterium]